MLRVKSDSELSPEEKRGEPASVTISRVEKRPSMSSSPDVKRGLAMEGLSSPPGGPSSGIRSYSDFMRSLAAKYNNNE